MPRLILRAVAGARVFVVVAVMGAGGGATRAWSTTYQYKSGQSLAEVATNFYGSPYYELVIARLNHLADSRAVPAGAQLRVPELKVMLFEENLPKNLEPEIEDIVKARYAYMRVRNDLLKAMESVQIGPRLPIAVKTALSDAADALEQAGKSLDKLGAHAETPVRMRQRLTLCAKNLRRLAAGERDKKLEDSIHLLLAQTFVRGIMWARKEGIP